MKIPSAVVERSGGPFVLSDVELAELRPDEVRVRLVATGMCHADLICRDQIFPVPLPAVFGHEGAGIVEEIGSAVQRLKRGDQVVIGFNYCGTCRFCRNGFPGNCETTHAHNFGGVRPDGSSPLSIHDQQISGWFFGQSSFATHANVSERIAVRVETTMPLRYVAPLACGAMTGIGAVWNVLRPSPGSSITILGTGAVGQSAIAGARLAGCETIIAVDVVPSRLALAREMGATHVVNARDTDPVEEVMSITGGQGSELALDAAAGAPTAFRQMLDMLSVRGHGVLVGSPDPGDEVQLDLSRYLNAGKRVSFVLEGDSEPQTFIPRAVKLMESGRLDLSPMMAFLPFDAIEDAAHGSESGKYVKPVLLFDESAA